MLAARKVRFCASKLQQCDSLVQLRALERGWEGDLGDWMFVESAGILGELGCQAIQDGEANGIQYDAISQQEEEQKQQNALACSPLAMPMLPARGRAGALAALAGRKPSAVALPHQVRNTSSGWCSHPAPPYVSRPGCILHMHQYHRYHGGHMPASGRCRWRAYAWHGWAFWGGLKRHACGIAVSAG